MLKKLIVYLLLAGLLIYVGIIFGTPYYHYYGFKSDMKELSTLRQMQVREMRAEVQESIHYYGVPVKIDEVSIERLTTGYRLHVAWEERVNFLGIYEKTYSFAVSTLR